MSQDLIVIRSGTSSAEISTFGAQVVAWKSPLPSTGNVADRLYLSPLSNVHGPEPIRGGIPIVFPYFGPSKTKGLPQHGWARKSMWQVRESTADAVKMAISQDGWNLLYEVQISQYSLSCQLTVESEEDSSFQALFHNYLRAKPDSLAVHGLPAQYRDKPTQTIMSTPSGTALVLEGETDRVYFKVDREIIVALDEQSGSTDAIAVRKTSLEDVVVWNPAAAVAKNMKDLPDDDWQDFVCVEPGMAVNEISIKAGERMVVSQTLECI